MTSTTPDHASRSKKGRVVSALTHACPVCGQSSIYKNPKPYTWKNMGDIKSECDHCHANLSPESGFYFGAAYVSYGLTVALWVTVAIALKVCNALGVIEYGFLTHPFTLLGTGAVLTVILFPYIFRVSRSIWAHMHISG